MPSWQVISFLAPGEFVPWPGLAPSRKGFSTAGRLAVGHWPVQCLLVPSGIPSPAWAFTGLQVRSE